METDRITLSYVVHCLLEGKNLESDAAKPLSNYTLPLEAEIFEPLLTALLSGAVGAQGTFARVQLDYPEIDYLEFDEDEINVQLSLLSADYRGRANIVIGVGAEAVSWDIPCSSWWFEGAIWEKSTLWVAGRGGFEEDRWRGLKVEWTVPFLPDRPYGFQELICFLDVTLNLLEIQDWADTHAFQAAKKPTKIARKTGPKPKENWEAIEEYLVKEIEAGREWVDWNAVWHSLLHLRSKKNPKKATTQPYKKLEKRLREHSPKLLTALRGRITTSRTKK